MSILHVDSITKSYNNKKILSDIYLSCRSGEIKGLIGRNGSGKSTLLKIIFGSEKPNSQFIKVDDEILKTMSDRRNRINYLPQHHFLPNHIKIKSLMKLFLPEAICNSLQQNYFLKPLLNKKNHELSGGERRIVEIFLIINSESKFVLLDEPFNGVSPVLKNYIVEYIKEKKPSKGFIITDHDYQNILDVSDKIIFLSNGYLREIKNESDLINLGYLPGNVNMNL
ncbi:ATP-binding cassette domain-containing protein [Abyssalbus ytuae]|uniref:ATP-binding cassette domain-containing protein n=1 Tax=Abyssalbus ytuae TaxID=2926907 RepID=A0A9E7CZG3_9FLAO|nr:ATP-binding cassette domain-containing protein [Abyssalbus ytuae]UOB17515.1 ATP-binding cassette domain-containing protein [Abyssalbus ytuae]